MVGFQSVTDGPALLHQRGGNPVVLFLSKYEIAPGYMVGFQEFEISPITAMCAVLRTVTVKNPPQREILAEFRRPEATKLNAEYPPTFPGTRQTK